MEIMKESIFMASIRSFFKVFFKTFGFFVALTLIILLIFLFSSDGEQEKNNVVYLPDAENQVDNSKSVPVLLRMDFHGVIGEDGLTAEAIETQLFDSQKDTFKGRIKGILLHLETPGGTVTDSNSIYRMLMEYKKKYKVPVYAYTEGLCASGGMYVSSAADSIYTGPVAIVGSIGTLIGPFFNVSQAFDKIGVQAKVVTDGKNKDMMSPFRPWEKDEEASIKEIVAFMYNNFIEIFTQGRPKVDRKLLVEEYGAKVFDPVTAQKIGYVDQINSSYREVLKDLAKAAKVEKYQVVRFESKGKWLSQLVTGKAVPLNGKIEHVLQFGEKKDASKGNVQYLYRTEKF